MTTTQHILNTTNSFYTQVELETFNFNSIGKNVLISKKASIYGAEKINIGNNVRIDDFTILSGSINIGNFVHISTGSVLMSQDIIILEDFCCISIQSKVLGSSDDFTGQALVGPCIPARYRKVTSKPIVLKKYSLLGCNSVILPGGNLAEGVSVGAMSLILKPTRPWGIYVGIPAKRMAQRNKNLLGLQKEFLSTYNQNTKIEGGGA